MGLLKHIFGKGKSIARIDDDSLIVVKEYDDEMRFIKLNIAEPGINDYLNQLEEQYQKYKGIMRSFLAEEANKEEQSYNQWEKVHKRKYISKRMVIITLISWIVLGCIVSSIDYTTVYVLLDILGVLGVVSGVLFFVSIAASIVFKIQEMLYAKRYHSFCCDRLTRAESINAEFIDYIEDIDVLVLQSLPAGIRNAELDRRQKKRIQNEMERDRIQRERQHSELMALKAKQLYEMQRNTEELKEINKRERERKYY